jgi:hypothetical protein
MACPEYGSLELSYSNVVQQQKASDQGGRPNSVPPVQPH